MQYIDRNRSLDYYIGAYTAAAALASMAPQCKFPKSSAFSDILKMINREVLNVGADPNFVMKQLFINTA